MTKILFDEKERLLLESNPYVKKVTAKTILYSSEFKEKFSTDYLAGKLPIQIFRDAGLDPEIIGRNRIQGYSQYFRKSVSVNKDNYEKESKNRTTKGKQLPEDRVKYLEHKVLILEQELSFLKKLEKLEQAKSLRQRKVQPHRKNMNSSTE